MVARSALRNIAAIIAGIVALAGPALAQDAQPFVEGAQAAAGPRNWEIWQQPAVTPIMENLEQFHLFLVAIITAISLFVLALLVYVMVRFNARRNPTPSRTSHNTTIEVLWTVVPVLILVMIAIPSFRLLYAEARIPPAAMTIKATGYQWYWNYAYPDNGDFAYDSLMVEDADLKPGQPRLLATDNPLVVPVNTNVRVIVTGADVIHAFAVPSFGVKIDAVPGRLNETWFRAEKVGTYYGQCSELCGVRHALMPIEVRVVPQDEFKAWVATQQKNAHLKRAAPTRVAAAAAQ